MGELAPNPLQQLVFVLFPFPMPLSATSRPLLDALRAAVAAPVTAALAAAPVPHQSLEPPQPLAPPAPAPVPPGAAQCLSVGPWCRPGSLRGAWGPLAAPCGHPGEADAQVALDGAPVALLRRRWHLVPAGDPDACHLAPVGLYELVSPGGRTVLTALASAPLLVDLAERIGAVVAMPCPV